MEFDRNTIPWDSKQTIIVKSKALMCTDPIYMQRIYPNDHFNGAYLMVFYTHKDGPKLPRSPPMFEENA